MANDGTLSNVGQLIGTLTSVQSLNGSLSSSQNVNGRVQIAQAIVADHTILTGRDAADQHPISAITELTDSLENLETEGISNWEIEHILDN